MFGFIITFFVLSLPLSGGGPPVATSRPAGQDVLRELREGNERFAGDHSAHPHADRRRRLETLRQGQHPVAAIISCSDSRVPVELIFDEGIGDLFVIRVAGNVCAEHETGSLEYALDHLQIPLLVIMGHEDCGAIKAVAGGEIAHGRVTAIVEHIKPVVEKLRREHPNLSAAELISMAARDNVRHSVRDLLESSATAREAIRTGRLMVVGAVYDLSSGRIEWLGIHPEQSRILAERASSDRAEGSPTTQKSNDAAATGHGHADRLE